MRHFFFALLSAGVCPAATVAQNADDLVVTAARIPQPASESGQSVSVIDGATLEARQTPILSDVLATTPGVNVARNGGVGGVTSLFIRGASSEQALVIIDGVPVNDPSSPGGGYDFGTLLSAGIARVEILRGADSVPWGSAAIGGVVNIVSVAPTSALSAKASVEGGSYGSTALDGHVSDTLGPLGFNLSGGWLHTGGISAFAASEGGKEADGFDQHYANARAEVRLAPNISLDLRGRYARSNVMIDGYNTPSFTFGDDAEYVITREASGYAALHADFGTLSNRLSYALANIHRNTYDAAQPPGAQFEYGYRGQDERIEYQGDWHVAKPLSLVFGVEHEQSSLFSAADIYGDAAFAYHTHIDSLYGQALVAPLPSVHLTGGLRYDHHAAFGDHVTASANGAWSVTSSTIVRASYAEGFKAPTLYQLYAPYYGTPTLKPESATSFDGGIEQNLGRSGVSLRATYFERRTNNLIDFNTASFTYANIARAFAQGIEAEATGRINANLVLAANYSFTRSINPDTGLRLARRPRDLANVSLDWSEGKLKLGGTLSTIGPSYDDIANMVRLHGYTLLSARASYALSPHLEIYARVENALDAQYQVVAHYGTLGRAAYAGVRVIL